MKTLLSAILFTLALATSAAAADWQAAQVPGQLKLEGEAWLRAWVKVHDSFFQKHERNLYEESVGFYLRDLAGAHEVWVNGVKIGSGGAMPPNYQPAGGQLYRHKVPVGTLRKQPPQGFGETSA